MYARVVRFTDVDADHIANRLEQMKDRDGPPEGVPAKGIQFLHDEEQRTAVVVQLFESLEDMKTGEEVLGAMDPADTPGTRASVDRCEIKMERNAP